MLKQKEDSVFIILKTPIELFKFAILYSNDVYLILQVALRILFFVAVSKAHIFNHCKANLYGPTRMHNSVLNALDAYLKNQGFNVDIDISPTEINTSLRHDLIIRCSDPKKIFLINIKARTMTSSLSQRCVTRTRQNMLSLQLSYQKVQGKTLSQNTLSLDP